MTYTRVFAGIACLAGILTLGSCQKESPSFQYAPGIKVYPQLDFQPPSTIPAELVSAVKPPEGMVFIPGGYTRIGSDEPEAQTWEKPAFWVQIKPFFMDIHPVTVAQFRAFIKATHYVTEAETFGDAGVLNEQTKAWELQKGANWEYPQGKQKAKAVDNHPVTQVSWKDATAYAKWAGKRLPHEFEWEHAARNATNEQTRYPWGNDLKPDGKFMANIWQGHFPDTNYVEDGFRFTSPVGYFGKTKLGLTDMTGNVWEWSQDWRQNYSEVIANKKPVNPTEKAGRGGSFLCEAQWCHGYRVSGRSFTTPETSLMHTGFRCVKDIPVTD